MWRAPGRRRGGPPRRVFDLRAVRAACLIVSGASAGAGAATLMGLTPDGQLEWSYRVADADRAGAPAVRQSFLGQKYRLGLNGPLPASALGDLRAGVSYSAGRNDGQLALANIVKQEALGYQVGLDLLPRDWRRVVILSPGFSRQQVSDYFGADPDRIDQQSRSLALGLNPPALPSLRYAVDLRTRRDAAPGVSRLLQDALDQSWTAAWTRGRSTLRVDRQSQVVTDRLGVQPERQSAILRGEARTELFQPGGGKALQSGFFQATLNRHTAGLSGQDDFGVTQGAASMLLTSRDAVWGPARHSVGLDVGGQWRTDDRPAYREEMSLSSRGGRRIALTNRLFYQRREAEALSAQAAGTRLTASHSPVRWMGLSGEAGERFDIPRTGEATATDSLGTRLDAGRSPVRAFVGVDFGNVRGLSDGGISRSVTVSPGSEILPIAAVSLQPRWTFSWSRDLRRDVLSRAVGQAYSLRVGPVAAADLFLTYTRQKTETEGSATQWTEGAMGDLSWQPIPGFRASFTVQATGAPSLADRRSVTALGGAGYTVGLTTFSLEARAIEEGGDHRYRTIGTTLARRF